MVMKKLVLQKVVTLAAAALALGSAFIANDVLGHALSSGAGGDHIGSGFPGAHMGAFPSGRIGGDFHAGLRDNHDSGRISRPFFHGDYGDKAQGFDCWKSQDVPTNAAWRLRQAGNGECY